MKSTDTCISQWRATFEDTKRKQLLFLHKLDELIQKNSPIPKKERDDFLNLLADSTFGLGTNEFSFWLNDGRVLRGNNFESFVRSLFYHESNTVDGDFFFKTLGRYKDFTVNIGELWMQVRNKCFDVFPEALAMSLRISKEREKREHSPGASLDEI